MQPEVTANSAPAINLDNIYMIKRDGSKEKLDLSKIERCMIWASSNLNVDYREIYKPQTLPVYDGMPTSELQDKLANLAATMIRNNKEWSYFAARLILQKLYKRANNGSIKYMPLRKYVELMVGQEVLDPKLLTHFNFEKLDSAVTPRRDLELSYMSVTTLSDRYLLKAKEVSGEEVIKEMPQHFFMRVAMGLALAEKKREATDWAIRFYNFLSTRRVISSTPTLFNSGTLHSQLSSCFLMEIGDGIKEIFASAEEASQYSKFSGGTAMSLTPLRAQGSIIQSTKGRANGVVPYAKIIESCMLGFDQSGKRAGSCAVYLETWHADIEEFLEMAKASGDPRRRTPDLFLANWIPDLFMKRVESGDMWSLFSPSDTPDLKDLWGEDFEKRYEEYEAQGIYRKQIKAKKLWKKIIKCLFNDQGMGWPCFKDEANRRSMTRGYGVVHSSNLCTEITLRTQHGKASAVCNLASVNLAQNKTKEEIAESVRVGVRMIDNAITRGYLPHKNGKTFNDEDRPLGLGVMGYTQWLVENGIDYESQEHLEIADELFEFIAYNAIDASSDLALEKGTFPRYEESQWAKGELPIDTASPAAIALTTREYEMPWDKLRKKIKKQGVRNSQMLAIAPTATIANIADCTNCTELPFKMIYTKGNLSGDFDIISPLYLQTAGTEYEYLAKTSAQVNQLSTVKAAAVRQKWVDQSQSTNIWVTEDVDGDQLSNIYITGWRLGLKTFYYLRSESTLIQLDNNEEDTDISSDDFIAPVCNMDEGCTVCQ